MMGVDQFDAIINPPQGSILAIGGISRVMTEMEDGSGEFMTSFRSRCHAITARLMVLLVRNSWRHSSQ